MTSKLTKIHLLISLSALSLAACGSDSGTGSGVAQAETVYGLGECEVSNEGAVKLVTSENQYYKCVDGDWEVTEAPVQSSSSNFFPFAGSSSSNKVFPGFDTKSSASSGLFSTDSESGNDPFNQTLIDERDGQVYRTVKIGDQVWMAENLNYEINVSINANKASYCYNDDPVNCAKYGRLYSGYVVISCPSGWHLPSRAEWEELIVAVDGSITEYDDDNTAGIKLKSTSGWYDDGNGTDVYSFSALPTGIRDEGVSYNEGVTATFWSSTGAGDGSRNWGFALVNSKAAMLKGSYRRDKWLSVRCIKD